MYETLDFHEIRHFKEIISTSNSMKKTRTNSNWKYTLTDIVRKLMKSKKVIGRVFMHFLARYNPLCLIFSSCILLKVGKQSYVYRKSLQSNSYRNKSRLLSLTTFIIYRICPEQPHLEIKCNNCTLHTSRSHWTYMLNQPRSSLVKRMLLRKNKYIQQKIQTKTTHFSDWLFLRVFFIHKFSLFSYLTIWWWASITKLMLYHVDNKYVGFRNKFCAWKWM